MFNLRDLNLTAENIANLTTLADFLWSGDIPPPKFDIGSYLKADYDFQVTPIEDEGGYLYTAMGNRAALLLQGKNFEVYSSCGTTACAIGHGPLAGIPVLPDEQWTDYEKRVFGVGQDFLYGSANHQAWEFMFGPDWSRDQYNNTAKGSALRIRYVLDSNDVSFKYLDIYDYRDEPESCPWFAGHDFHSFRNEEAVA